MSTGFTRRLDFNRANQCHVGDRINFRFLILIYQISKMTHIGWNFLSCAGGLISLKRWSIFFLFYLVVDLQFNGNNRRSINPDQSDQVDSTDHLKTYPASMTRNQFNLTGMLSSIIHTLQSCQIIGFTLRYNAPVYLNRLSNNRLTGSWEMDFVTEVNTRIQKCMNRSDR